MTSVALPRRRLRARRPTRAWWAAVLSTALLLAILAIDVVTADVVGGAAVVLLLAFWWPQVRVSDRVVLLDVRLARAGTAVALVDLVLPT